MRAAIWRNDEWTSESRVRSRDELRSQNVCDSGIVCHNIA